MNRKIKKEVRQLIKEAQINGQTNKEIYSKLVQEYDNEEFIARLIVTTIKPNDKKRHRLYNGILLGLTAIIVLFNVWIIRKSTDSWLWYNQNDYLFNRSFSLFWFQIGQFVFFYILILFNNILRKTITSYIFWMYSCSYLIFYFLFLDVLPNLAVWGTYWLYAVIDLLSIAFIIFLARFFQRKIFPDYRYLRLKRDEDGEYIFS